jgi:hypothetical protein
MDEPQPTPAMVTTLGAATVTDLELNALGATLSFMAVVTTCISQIWTNTMQKQFAVGLAHTPPLCASSARLLCFTNWPSNQQVVYPWQPAPNTRSLPMPNSFWFTNCPGPRN